MAAFSRMTVQDARKLLTPEEYPPWVIFPQMEKVVYIVCNLLVLEILTCLNVN